MVLEISLFFSPPGTQAIPLAPGLGQRVELRVPGATRVLAGKRDASRRAPHSSAPLERGVQEEKGTQGSGGRRSRSPPPGGAAAPTPGQSSSSSPGPLFGCLLPGPPSFTCLFCGCIIFQDQEPPAQPGL